MFLNDSLGQPRFLVWLAKPKHSFAFVRIEDGRMATILHCCAVFLPWFDDHQIFAYLQNPYQPQNCWVLQPWKWFNSQWYFGHLSIWNDLSQYFHIWLQNNSNLPWVSFLLALRQLGASCKIFFSEIVNPMHFSLRTHTDLWFTLTDYISTTWK